MSQAWIPRKRRGAETLLALMALAVGVGGFAATALTISGSLTSEVVWLSAGLVIVGIGTMVAVRWLAPYSDPALLPLVLCLNGLGLAMIHRLDVGRAELNPDRIAYASTQLTWTFIGLVVFAVTLYVVKDHRRLQSLTYTFGLASIVLLVLPLLPLIGREINGARIWIHLWQLSFQPGEAAKIALAIFFAGYLVVKRDALALAGRRVLGIDLPRGRDLGPILLGWAISVGILVFQRDLGSSLLYFGLFVVMLYIATERAGWIVVGGLLFTVGTFLGYQAFGHVRARFTAWSDPFADVDNNYQIVSGLYGLAHGGLLGRGWGGGSPQLTPFSFSDFIAASLGEELGLTGLMAILLIYALIVERGLRIALTCRDAFGKLLAAGLAVSMAIQVFVVIGGVTRLIPLTGLTTPFLAQGGSSIIMNWAIIALLLRISDQTRRPAPTVAPLTRDEATQVIRL